MHTQDHAFWPWENYPVRPTVKGTRCQNKIEQPG